MATTTSDAVYRALQTRLAAVVNSITDDTNRSMVCTSPQFLQLAAPYFQIIIGPGESLGSRGGHGRVREEFDVVIFDRIALDVPGSDTKKLTDSTEGLLVARNTVWGTGIQGTTNGLNGHVLNLAGANFMPILLLRWGRPQVNPRDPAWAMVPSTFRLEYEISY